MEPEEGEHLPEEHPETGWHVEPGARRSRIREALDPPPPEAGHLGERHHYGCTDGDGDPNAESSTGATVLSLTETAPPDEDDAERRWSLHRRGEGTRHDAENRMPMQRQRDADHEQADHERIVVCASNEVQQHQWVERHEQNREHRVPMEMAGDETRPDRGKNYTDECEKTEQDDTHEDGVSAQRNDRTVDPQKTVARRARGSATRSGRRAS